MATKIFDKKHKTECPDCRGEIIVHQEGFNSYGGQLIKFTVSPCSICEQHYSFNELFPGFKIELTSK